MHKKNFICDRTEILNGYYILFSQSLDIPFESFQRSSRLKIIFESEEEKEPVNHDQ